MTNINSSSAIFSHNTEELETPQELFDELNKEFHFGIDVCATHENAKCENFFSKKDDGLKQNWGGTELFGAIPHMETPSDGGCEKHLMKHPMETPLLC